MLLITNTVLDQAASVGGFFDFNTGGAHDGTLARENG